MASQERLSVELSEEIADVTSDLSWLDKCTCAQLPIEAYFVTAGQTITPETLNVARSCPARREEVIFAYARQIKPGYFGGLSAGQRQSMSLTAALEFIKHDPPVELEDNVEKVEKNARARAQR